MSLLVTAFLNTKMHSTKRTAKILPNFSDGTASPSPRDGAGTHRTSRWAVPENGSNFIRTNLINGE